MATRPPSALQFLSLELFHVPVPCCFFSVFLLFGQLSYVAMEPSVSLIPDPVLALRSFTSNGVTPPPLSYSDASCR